ncbi:MAG: hypothetical protein JWR19_4514 [Pedosphaera sp.]|nr:hypothetical protein [Pedosphaera sp.]
MTWITEQCWAAYLPLLEAQKIEPLPKFPPSKIKKAS